MGGPRSAPLPRKGHSPEHRYPAKYNGLHKGAYVVILVEVAYCLASYAVMISKEHVAEILWSCAEDAANL